ncbi:MAG: restriction endonuclease subunit S [Chloroflexi bacterium]|nr:restriction endonuclease subunit S [Chloroflexota bacterium]
MEERNGWRQMTIAECAVINDSTYSPKENWPFINYLDTGNITANRISEFQHLVVGRDKVPSRARRKCQVGDIVYSTVRPNQRHFGILRELPDNFLASTGFATIRAREGRACTGFLYWFLAQDHIVDHLHTIGEHSTSAYPSIKPSDIATLEISLPPLDEQRAIAHVLGTLDDKIELNRRMNETLEAMARALFRSWFVDFEPVRAKMEGRWRPGESLPGLPAHLHPLFPDRLVPSELGDIPEGWEVRTLGDLVEVERGLSYKGSGLSPDGMPLYNLNSIYEGGGYKPEGIKHYAGDYKARHLVRPGEVVVANTEQGHDRLLIGYAAVVPHTATAQGLFSHHLYRVRPADESGLTPDFICALLNTPAIQGVVSGYANGTTVNMLPLDALRLPSIAVPAQALTMLFGTVAKANRERQEQMAEQSSMLASLRTLLLPELVSGELRLPAGKALPGSEGGPE